MRRLWRTARGLPSGQMLEDPRTGAGVCVQRERGSLLLIVTDPPAHDPAAQREATKTAYLLGGGAAPTSLPLLRVLSPLDEPVVARMPMSKLAALARLNQQTGMLETTAVETDELQQILTLVVSGSTRRGIAMSKGSRSRRRRKEAERVRRGQQPSNELVRLDPGHLRGIAVVSPTEHPPGLELDYAGACARLTEHAAVVVPQDGPQVIEPRPSGYALIAMADPDGHRLTAVTTETDKARQAIGLWRDGIPYGEVFALTNDTIIAYVRGWPLPTVANPELAGPVDFPE